MGTNVRGHTVPLGSEAPVSPQEAIRALGLSLNDVVLAASATQRATRLTDIGSSAARPLLVWQTDTGVLWVHNGTAWLPAGGAAISGAVTYGSIWRAPNSQPCASITVVKTGKTVTVMGGAFENFNTLTLGATGQNANALTLPPGCAPVDKVHAPAVITNTSAFTLTLGDLWFLADGSVTFQTSAAISAAPAGTISVAIGGANWVTT